MAYHDKNDKFCGHCGTELRKRLVPNDYDVHSGKQNTEKYCPNVTCELGCGDNGGHKYRWFNQTNCTRCGHVSVDIFY